MQERRGKAWAEPVIASGRKFRKLFQKLIRISAPPWAVVPAPCPPETRKPVIGLARGRKPSAPW